MSDHGHFSSYEGHKERRTGKIRGAFSRMYRALDGWIKIYTELLKSWLARRLHQLKASTTMDLGITVFLVSVQCVALRNLDLLIKTGWSVIFPFLC